VGVERAELLDRVADAVVALMPGHPLRVGVDGVCGAGKTTFATALAARLAETGRPVIRLDPDGFHNVREVRYRQGRESARGYYEDAFDFESLQRLTLEPLGPGGSRRYAVQVHDLETDEVLPSWADAPADAIVVFDETFLQRDGLRDHWDVVIFLDVRRQRAVERGVQRDAERLGGEATTRGAYESRYMAACDIYLAEQDPRGRASIVIDNDDPANPRLVTPL
jgi:uridine kinase